MFRNALEHRSKWTLGLGRRCHCRHSMMSDCSKLSDLVPNSLSILWPLWRVLPTTDGAVTGSGQGGDRRFIHQILQFLFVPNGWWIAGSLWMSQAWRQCYFTLLSLPALWTSTNVQLTVKKPFVLWSCRTNDWTLVISPTKQFIVPCYNLDCYGRRAFPLPNPPCTLEQFVWKHLPIRPSN